jgi:hypothetical protein
MAAQSIHLGLCNSQIQPHHMKRRKVFAIFTMFFGMCCYAQTSQNTDGGKPISSEPVFSITVDPPPGPIHLGSPINVTITLTNVSGKEIYLAFDRGSNSGYKAFKILLTKDGREVETSLLNRRLTGRLRPDDPSDDHLLGSSILLPYPPGKMLVMMLDLTKLHEIKESGLYKLEVSRFDEYTKTIVRSKPLNLTIVP